MTPLYIDMATFVEYWSVSLHGVVPTRSITKIHTHPYTNVMYIFIYLFIILCITLVYYMSFPVLLKVYFVKIR